MMFWNVERIDLLGKKKKKEIEVVDSECNESL